MKRMLVALLMAMISAGLVFALPATASAQATVGISVGYAPPPLPWYPQPVCPGAGYLWTPGYWAWGAEGYFWVPGSWAFAPATGLLWTPGYWAWDDGLYWWHPGYWAQDVGFYGGIDYGYGYYGAGYLGGYWRDGDFYYNREIDDLDDGGGYHVYDGPAQPQAASNHLSYNGGYGGVAMRPTAAQEKYAREQHWKATSVQRDQERLASADPQQRYALNRGMPRIVATTRAGEFPAVDRMPRQAQLGGY
ncbi:MAG: YXWGXW repeat-containing protein, partial [Gammaproteobacteria bacterium]|nr:YXWGXW repeat-containing protein [Gammaproteobacteria bacterium]